MVVVVVVTEGEGDTVHTETRLSLVSTTSFLNYNHSFIHLFFSHSHFWNIMLTGHLEKKTKKNRKERKNIISVSPVLVKVMYSAFSGGKCCML